MIVKRQIQSQPASAASSSRHAFNKLRALVRSWPLFLSALFLVALLIRIYRLDAQSLWLDELNTWWLVAKAPWSALLADMWRSESAYPLYHLLLKGWIALAGDSAWALRFPSALAGAVAVVAIALAAKELQDLTVSDKTASSMRYPLAAGVLLAIAPFALWYAQEVKTYGLILCTSALTIWLLLRALRCNNRASWLAFAAIALMSVFAHRFALLLLLGCATAWLVCTLRDAQEPHDRTFASRVRWWLLSAGVGIVLAGSILIGQMTQGLGEEGATTGEHIAAGPPTALWITLWRFLLDRGPWEAPWWWLLPGLALAAWGGALLLRAAWRGERAALTLLCCGGVPLGLFLTQLWWTRLFEPRYLIIVYPIWILTQAYPFADNQRQISRRSPLLVRFAPALLLLTCLTWIVSLFQPVKGLWSGDPVKEQYREAIHYLVDRAHPDDVVILHPEYLRTAWDYYAPRFTTSLLPPAVSFDAFKKNQVYFSQRDWDTSREKTLAGHFRSLLLIAPAHASTVDKPKSGDEYGLVGLYYQYSWEQNKWPCGGARFNGVHVLCQSSPEAYVTGEIDQPQVQLDAQFGDDIHLMGYSLDGGTFRAKGTVPVTLFWDTTHQPDEDYFVFLHVCQDCTIPPLASDDGPPLGGGVPTSIWKPGHPVHDERTIVLPDDIPPGRYTVLLGLYRPGDPTLDARLKVTKGEQIGDNRLILGTIDIKKP